MLSISQLRKAPKKNYMNDEQLEFFHDLLMKEYEDATEHLREAKLQISQVSRENDDLDKAQNEEESRMLLRIVERESQLLRKIENALERIKTKEYGYCEETGEPIGINRLIVRPTATLCAEEKKLQESIERNFSL